MVTDQDIWKALAQAPNVPRCTVIGTGVSQAHPEPFDMIVWNPYGKNIGGHYTYSSQSVFWCIRNSIDYERGVDFLKIWLEEYTEPSCSWKLLGNTF